MTKRVDLPQGTLEILIWKFRVPRAFAWIQHSASHPANFRRTLRYLRVRFAPPSTVLNGVDGSKANERIRERPQSKVLSPDEVRQTQLKEETAKWSDMAGIAASILFETETLSRRQ